MPSKWPESFTYVCNAGRSGIVNALPIAHAGIDAIRRVVVFCGASGPNTTNAHERAEAVLPAHALRDAVARWSQDELSKEQNSFSIIYGPSADIGYWNGIMQNIIAEEGSRDGKSTHILFNLKGGTKEMAIGSILALYNEQGLDYSLVTVGDQPLRVEMVGAQLQEPLPKVGFQLSLDMYLQIYGFREHVDDNPERRRTAFEGLCRANGSALKAFGHVLLPYAINAWPALQTISRPIDYGGDRYSLGVDILSKKSTEMLAPSDPAIHIIRRSLAKFVHTPGFRIELSNKGLANSCYIDSIFAARVVRGAWLEALLYLEILDLVKSRQDVEVAGNLGLAYRARPNERVTEIDVAIMSQSQLLLIEAKSSNMTNKSARETGERSFAQLDSNKRQILGQVGPALIVNPCVDPVEMESKAGAIGERLVRGGEEAFLGPSAIDNVLERIKRFIG